MAADLSFFAYFAPIAAFLVVFAIVFAILSKTQLFGDKFPKIITLIISFLVATLFVSAAGVRRYAETVIPWLAVLVISLFFILLFLGFIGKPTESMYKGVGVFVLIVAGVIFLVSGLFVFSASLGPYLPFSYGYVGNDFTDWLFSGPVLGALLLIIVTLLVSWILVKTK